MAGVLKSKKEKDVVEKSVEKTPAVKATKKTKTKFSNSNLDGVLLTPRITEKATDLQMGHNAYTFNVLPRATKTQISQAIKMIYGVDPLSVKIVNIASKMVMSRKGKKGVKSGGKKAYVRLKKGDSIEFV